MIRSFAAFAAVSLAGCAITLPHQDTRAGSETAAVWVTSADQSRKLARLADIPVSAARGDRTQQVVVGSDPIGPPIVGFGAAMTDASAQLIQKALSRRQRDALFGDLFGPRGIGISFVRVPIGASDFSLDHYSLDDMPAGQTDPKLRHFSMARAKATQIPALRSAQAHNPRLTLMASPWSAPGWMKTTDSLIKGRLRREFYPAYARYFVRYLDGMAAAGLPVDYVSMQNEPDFEPTDYPGMRASAEERAAFIGGHLGPLLASRKPGVAILEWDHNWDKPDQPRQVLADPAAQRHVGGVAWHCYGGDPKAMAAVKADYPDKDLFFTECSGGGWAPDWGGTLGWMTDNLIIAPARVGGRGALLWNLALDQDNGPHLGGCGNCRGVVTIDPRSRAITRNVEYYVLGQASKFIRPGARLVRSEGGPSAVRHVAFRNEDGTMALLLHNGGNSVAELSIANGATGFDLHLPAGEVATVVWRADLKAR